MVRARRTASAAAAPATIKLAVVSTPSRWARSTAWLTAGERPKSSADTMTRRESGATWATYAASLRSFRNWKNSTPSRSRRFIMVGLRTISPTMAAILGARK